MAHPQMRTGPKPSLEIAPTLAEALPGLPRLLSQPQPTGSRSSAAARLPSPAQPCASLSCRSRSLAQHRGLAPHDPAAAARLPSLAQPCATWPCRSFPTLRSQPRSTSPPCASAAGNAAASLTPSPTLPLTRLPNPRNSIQNGAVACSSIANRTPSRTEEPACLMLAYCGRPSSASFCDRCPYIGPRYARETIAETCSMRGALATATISQAGS
jgi:hypothetical protein